jgi:hypothetical protein
MTPQKNEAEGAEKSLASPLLFISYFTGIKGNCPAEWADDKIRVLEHAGRRAIVLTGMGSHVEDRSGVHYVRVPSLAWGDYREEVRELKAADEPVPMGMRLFMPFAFIFGSVIDFVLRKVTRGISGGRWPWLLTALPVAMWLKVRYGVRDVFCTGGPTSAHMIGGLVVKLTGGRLVCEFQDPLLGAAMTRSSVTRRISTRIETFLVKNSIRAVYVTKVAALTAQERNPAYATQIAAVYPGAWQFAPPVLPIALEKCGVFEFLHLGTLYGSRNLDLFFQALDSLRREGFALAQAVRVVNLGAVYCETAPIYLERSDFLLLNALDRVDALERARKASCLMLVQHTAELSRETIPYKTYDYLNLGLPMFGMLNNYELRALIESCGGHTAQADDLEAIKSALRVCLTVLADPRPEGSARTGCFDISKQFLRVLECLDGGR